MRRAVTATMVTLLTLGTAAATATDEDVGTGLPGSADVVSVLFVGNSFTSMGGGVDKHFATMVEADEDLGAIEIDVRANGNWPLDFHVAYGTADEIVSGRYSVVVLQGQVHASGVDSFADGTRELDALVRGAGGETVLYMTWYMEPVPSVDLGGIVEVHRQLAGELGAQVAPVGLAIEKAQAGRPDIATLEVDRMHQTQYGAYLAAAVIYPTIFGRSPEGLPWEFDFGVPPTHEEMAYLQRLAWETVQEWDTRAAPAE